MFRSSVKPSIRSLVVTSGDRRARRKVNPRKYRRKVLQKLGFFLSENKSADLEMKFRRYYDFLTKVNFTNSLIVLPEEHQNFVSYRY